MKFVASIFSFFFNIYAVYLMIFEVLQSSFQKIIKYGSTKTRNPSCGYVNPSLIICSRYIVNLELKLEKKFFLCYLLFRFCNHQTTFEYSKFFLLYLPNLHIAQEQRFDFQNCLQIIKKLS